MPDADLDTHPQQFLHSLRRYVRSPLSTAVSIVERERAELTAELNAVEAFRERLAAIEPVVTSGAQSPTPGPVLREPTDGKMDRVSSAYRETIMSVEHYRDVYGESLFENVAAEFGADIAGGICHEESVPFTEPYKKALRTAAARAERRRRSFVEILDGETRSIERARTELTGVLAELDTTVIPGWHREPFTDHLDDIAQERQEILRTRRMVPDVDEHSLCLYLYGDEPWTYPVLTAVARIRETVVLE